MEFPLLGKSSNLNITHIKRTEINRDKWEQCVQSDPIGLPYASFEMLDILCHGKWNALIANDYEQVMPLPFNQKFILFPQVYQPVFFQQGGIFGAADKDLLLTAEFLKSIPDKYRKVAFNIKSDNMVPAFLKAEIRKNYILSLEAQMDELRSAYHRSLRRRIRIARRGPLSIIANDHPSFPINEFFRMIELYFVPLSNSLKKMGTKRVVDTLRKVLDIEIGKAFVAKDQKDKILSGCICLVSKSRATLIVTATSKRGRKMDATHLMLDHVIETMMRSGCSCFDFEGSSIKGVAEFYRQFGASEELYYTVRRIFGKWKNSS
jgi:hypothetical protein